MKAMETPPRFRLVSLILCIAGAALNISLSRLNGSVLHLPLFIDTIFTIALTFSHGLPWGILTGVLTHLASNSIFSFEWPMYLYTLCSIVTALITALFIRLFPGELRLPIRRATLRAVMDRVIVLLMLSFTLCIIMSVQGGLTAALIESLAFSGSQGTEGPELLFKLTLFRRNLPLVGVEILSRIPLNIIDRLISAFCGYGIALLLSVVNHLPRFMQKTIIQ
jgi:hypothetical protein